MGHKCLATWPLYTLGMALMAGLAGCGSSLPTATGRVTLDGELLTSGFVSFEPVSTGGTMTTAKIDSDGRYFMRTGSQRGVQAGSYRVAVTAYKTTPGRNALVEPRFELATPRNYNDPATSGITVEIEAGTNVFDIDLVSNPDAKQ